MVQVEILFFLPSGLSSLEGPTGSPNILAIGIYYSRPMQSIGRLKLASAAIRDFLGAGKIVPQLRKDGRLSAELVINNRDTIENIIIPLITHRVSSTKKLNQFNNWIKEHFNLPPTINNSVISANWLSGFVDGDGSPFFFL